MKKLLLPLIKIHLMIDDKEAEKFGVVLTPVVYIDRVGNKKKLGR